MLRDLTLRKNWPIVRITVIDLSVLAGVILLQICYTGVPWHFNLQFWLWLVVGFAYTHAYEYFHHRFPMHARLGIKQTRYLVINYVVIPINKLLSSVRKSHKKHHQKFSGNMLQSDKAEDLRTDITGPWWFFPIAFTVHYIILRQFLPIEAVTYFAVGTTLHYLLYEIPHFLAHSKNNKIDKAIFTIPFIGYLRRMWINYHLIGHHRNLKANYSITPPWLDWLLGTRSQKT